MEGETDTPLKLTRWFALAAVSAAMSAAAPLSSFAQSSTQSAAVEAEAISSVYAFNRICYAQVPDVEAIGQMAQDLVWRDVNKADLEAFDTGGGMTVLDGWDAQIGQRVYRVAVSRGPVLESQISAFPEFENGNTTTCSLVLDGSDSTEQIEADMQALAGKEPVSEDVMENGLSTTTWAGGNDDIKVFLVAGTGGQQGGILSVTVLTK